MSQESNEPIVSEKSIYRKQYIFGGVLLAVVLLVWFFYPTIKSSIHTYMHKDDPVVAFDTLAGNIYLTLAPKDSTTADIYEFNLVSKQLQKMFTDTDEERIRLTAKISPDGNEVAYVDTSIDSESAYYYPSSEWFQLRVLDLTTGVNTKITDTEDPSKRLGNWSPDGKKIAYTAQISEYIDDTTDTTAQFYDLNKWVVFIVDIETKEQRVIDRGTHPFWSPDGRRILYMKSDGLYLYDTTNDTKRLVLGVTDDFVATVNMKLDVSDDGKLLALSIPDNKDIYLYTISSWDLGIIDNKRTIVTSDSFVFWPVFSPDSRYLAFQEADINTDTKEVTNARLSLYDTKTNTKVDVLTLEDYNFDVAFTSDWK